MRHLLLITIILLGFGCFFAQNSALSSHLSAKDNVEGDILVKTLKVPHKTLYTYYCGLMWNVGSDGGGYCGIQNHPSGNNFIFSIWDPVTNNEPIKAVFTGKGTQVENFGGEGTGLKSWNFELGWIEGRDYQLVTRLWDKDNSTYFGYWVFDVENQTWTHLVTMDFPVKNVRFHTTTGSFIEDWLDTGQNMRKVFQKNGYKRDMDNNWIPFNTSHYSINTYDIEPGRRSYNYKDNYDAGTEDGYFYMQTGGNTTPSFSGYSKDLTLSFPDEPENSTIDFFITEVSENKISWTVPQSSSPQFSFTIIKNGSQIASGISPETREYEIDANEGNFIQLVIEDIFGRTKSKMLRVGSTETVPKTPEAFQVVESGFNNMIVKWNKSSNAQTYKLQMFEDFVWTDITTTTDTTFNIQNLEEGKTYRLRVSASNSYGESAFSEYIEAKVNSRVVSQENWTLVYVNSQEIYGENGKAENAFDGNPSTNWHTNWSGSNPPHPHEIQIDLGAKYQLYAFLYLPRQDGGENGTIKDYEFYVSDNTSDWGDPVATGTFEANLLEKQVDFPLTSGRYIRLVATSEKNGNNWTSAAEINVLGSIYTSVKSKNETPESFKLFPSYPNPFNPSVTISFYLPETNQISIRIYNSLGENIRTLFNAEKPAGNGKIVWDGKTSEGQNCPSGVYILEVITDNKTFYDKLLLLK